MRYIDIKVGLKYRVKEDIDIFIKRGAVVVIDALARLAQKCNRPAKVYLPKDTKDFQIEFI